VDGRLELNGVVRVEALHSHSMRQVTRMRVKTIKVKTCP
jgi:hypothetical protein